MKLFSKKYSSVQSLVFVSILAAITIVLFSILNYFTYAFIIVTFIFPFLGVFVGLNVNKYYSFLYFFVSILICVFINLYDLSNLIFYLLPSLLSGLIISFLLNKSISIKIQILLVSLFYFIYLLISIPIINTFYEVDFLNTLSILFFGENSSLSNYIFIPSIFIVEFIKTMLIYFILYCFNQKYKIITNFTAEPKYFYGIALIALSILGLISYALNYILWLPVLVIIINFIILIFSLTKLNYKKPITYIALSISFILTIIIYVCFYKYIESPYEFILLNSFAFIYGNFCIFNEIINNH